jgi:ATP-dependent helicase/nuclease subunit A
VTGAALGTFMHRCFEVLGARPELVERIPSITGLEVPPGWLAAIAAGVSRFEEWLAVAFAGGVIRREWPLLALDEHGSVVSGTADLVVETADGVWVIDHKSDQVVDPRVSFVGYLPQLEAYAQALEKQGRVVRGVAINWMRRGEVTLQRRPVR